MNLALYALLIGFLALISPLKLSAIEGCETAESTFDIDIDGWTGEGPPNSVQWISSGEQHYLQFHDSPEATWVFAPAKFLGDWSGGDRTGRISFMHQVIDFGAGEGTAAPFVIQIAGPAGTATWQSALTPTEQNVWQLVQAPLEEASWTVEGDWQGLLSSVTELRIQMDLINNQGGGGQNDIGGLNDVRLELCPDEGGPCLGDFNGDNRVVVNELVTAVTNALRGCAPPYPAGGRYRGTAVRTDTGCNSPDDNRDVTYTGLVADIVQEGGLLTATITVGDQAFAATFQGSVDPTGEVRGTFIDSGAAIEGVLLGTSRGGQLALVLSGSASTTGCSVSMTILASR